MKPPKCWLQEYSTEERASKQQQQKRGNDSSIRSNPRSSRDADSFRHYMVRKIELQNQQFGLILPPVPSDNSTYPVHTHGDDDKVNDSNDNYNERSGFGLQAFPTNNQCNNNNNNPNVKPATTMTTHKRKSKSILYKYNMKNVIERLNQKSHLREFSGRKSKLQRLRKRQEQDEQQEEENIARHDDDEGCKNEYVYKYPLDGIQHCNDCNKDNQDDLCVNERSNDETQNDYSINDGCKDTNKGKIQSCNITSPIHMTTNDHEKPIITYNPYTNNHTSNNNNNNINNQIKRTRPDLFFYGITIMVNGYTTPDDETIKRLIHKHGGNFVKYETVGVTHIIAECLSTAKAKMYKKQKKPIPVVTPKWILDCVDKGILLPYAEYLLEQVHDRDVNPSVACYFQKQKVVNRNGIDCNNNRIDRGDCNDGDGDDNQFTKLSKMDLNIMKQPLIEDHNPLTPCVSASNETKSTPHHKGTKQNIQQLSSFPSSPSSSATTTPCSNTKNGEITCNNSTNNNNDNTSDKRLNVKYNNNSNHITTCMKTVGTDPHFLESYFANSRLSFIGSFKQRITQNTNHNSDCNNGTTHCNSKATHYHNQQQHLLHHRSHSRGKRFVFHIDMDYFFAAIAIRNYPQYKNHPVAVSHAWKQIDCNTKTSNSPSKSKKSYSELSTCNYIARSFGVRKGMFLHRAKELCPNLIILPYDFEGYEETSTIVYEILRMHIVDNFHGCIEQVSCDESYCEVYIVDQHEDEELMQNQYVESLLDLSDHDAEPHHGSKSPEGIAYRIANNIREKILERTECTASIGIGSNKLLAKLATNKVKNGGGNGVYMASNIKKFMQGIKLKDIPGIGWSLNEKLSSHNLMDVDDVWNITEGELCSIIGEGNGKKVYKFCHGEDDREVKAAERKSIGAECNYGVRFDGPYGVDYMLKGLADEVEKRMSIVGVMGRHITLKVKERMEGAPPPGKFNGHGKCNDHSKSCMIRGNEATRDSKLIASEALALYNSLGLNKEDIRGMGIIISKLESDDEYKRKNETHSGMVAWLNTSKIDNTTQRETPITTHESKPMIEITSENKDTNSIVVQGETDESIARRLAAQWELEDQQPLSRIPRTYNQIVNRKRPLMKSHRSTQPKRKKVIENCSNQPTLTQLGYECSNISVENDVAITRNVEVVRNFSQNDEHDLNDATDTAWDDLLVIKDFMNNRKNPSVDDVQKIQDYLCICVKEKRALDDVLSFLNSIKLRKDAWSELHYLEIVRSTNECIEKHYDVD